MGKIEFIVILLSLLLTLPSFTQSTVLSTTYTANSPTIEWLQEYGVGSGLRAVIQTSDGGYAMAGVAMNIMIGGVAPWLVKVDSSGNKQWKKFYFDEKMNVNLGGANSIIQLSDGGYVLAGGSYLYSANFTGDLQWRRSYSDVEIASLVNSGDGYTIAGTQRGSLWLAKVDLGGQIIWNYTYQTEKTSVNPSMVQTSDGGYAIGSNLNTGESGYTCWLVKTDSLGKMLWNQTYSRPPSFLGSLVQANDGGFVLVGSISDINDSGGNSSVLLVKTDFDGKAIWNQTYNYGGGWSVLQSDDGGYAFACGSFRSGSLVKTDSIGRLQWDLAFNSTVYSVIQVSDGSYVLVGSNGGGDNWLAKVNADLDNSSPSPSVPELSWLLIVPLLLAVFSVAVIFRYRKTANHD